ncbi:ribbon-helix-helix domain-containing protein [Jeotgalibacillus terrae]|uniref:CopG family transcriptional regulator n=1 Tax=Jeotgalibacillus terrae TaxID=587735 RepID=A0ABW5ZIS5_9BACL|nr:hypothetical protein [Jeotgalibacillus terrae]MBM7580822.1 putative RND superfamily exporter protein [Jeotgalibacillus terrae]
MSSKNSLKDKIRKPNASQAFFNSYDANDNTKDHKTEHNINNDKGVSIKDNSSNNTTIDNENTIKVYVKNDDVVNDNEYLRRLATGKKAVKKKPKKVFTSFYMDPDLASEVDKIAARGEKGDKSKLINQGIRTLLEGYGVIEKKS